MDSGHSYLSSKVDEIDSQVPVVGAHITTRGYQTANTSREVEYNNWSELIYDGNGGSATWTNLIRAIGAIQSGDSGGGAIGRIIDAGRTNCIVAINKGTNSTRIVLIKGTYILNSY